MSNAFSPPEDDFLQVITSCGDHDQAQELARGAIDARLAACVQITAAVTSIYRWEGKVEQSAEVLCIFKTSRAAYPALEALIRSRHTYTLPEILAIPVVTGSADYLNWLRAELAAGGGQ